MSTTTPPTGGHQHADTSLDAVHLDEVADGVFAYVQPDGTWWINNCGALAGPDRTAPSSSTPAAPSAAPGT